MRRFLATRSNCAARLAPVLLGVFLVSSSGKVAVSDSAESNDASHLIGFVPACGLEDIVVHQQDPSPTQASACASHPRTSAEITEARAYVVGTATPGYTMTLQGMDLAVGRLHPEFVVRLANAIREARTTGLTLAGVFSAYRPPAFGVGGFVDKFHSLHTYGLAVDMHGIGKPGSPEAQLWHEIAARNGVVCPYGPRSRAEWNHCQPTSLKIILAENPLRETVTVDGPLDLESMFEVGNSVIESMASAADSLAKAEPTPVRVVEAAAKKIQRKPEAAKNTNQRVSRSAAARGGLKSSRRSRDKLDARLRLKKTPVIAVEEGRPKSKAPAVVVSPRQNSRSS